MNYIFKSLTYNIKNLSVKFILLNLTLAIFLILFGMYTALYWTPDDYLQKNLVKIMYVHVPCAWLSMLLYSMLAFSSFIFLIKRIILFDIIAYHTAKIAFLNILVTILTGAIWGKPAWGTWWVWDARLTSMLILMFIVLTYIIVRNLYKNNEVSARIGSIVALVGFLNIPLIKFSVNFWSTLHQKSTFFTMDGPKIHHSMSYPVIMIFLGITLLSFCAIVARVKHEMTKKRLARYEI